MIRALTILQNGVLISSGYGLIGNIEIWNLKDGSIKRNLTGLTNAVHELAILKNGDIISGHRDGTIKIWNVTLTNKKKIYNQFY